MALVWSWAFGQETTSQYQAEMDWKTFASAGSVSFQSASDKVYSYIGSPTRYSHQIATSGSGFASVPAVAVAPLVTSLEGWVAMPVKRYGASALGSTSPIIAVTGYFSPSGTSNIRIQPVNSTGTVTLYVDNVFKSTSAVYDWSSWHYVALRWDMGSTTPGTWQGEMYIDGTLEGSGNDARADAVVDIDVIYGSPGSSANPWLVGQIILYDAIADSGETPLFVTRVEPTADGTNVGTWTPSTGSDDFAVVDSPFDTATFTEETSPTSGDKLEVLTSGAGGTDDLTTQLGITPTSVAGVTAHVYGVGQTITARAVVRDGPAAASSDAATGDTATVDVSTPTYATATATTKSGAVAWTGSDAPALVYDVVTA